MNINQFNPINGWTKSLIIERIRAEFRGVSVDNEYCLYRASEGKKCAVGIFIPDFAYESEMERKGVTQLLTDFPNLKQHMPLPISALRDLQMVHDSHQSKTRPDHFDVSEIENADEACLDAMIRWIDKRVVDVVERVVEYVPAGAV